MSFSRLSPNFHRHFFLIKQELQPLKASQQELNSKIANYMSRDFNQASDQFIL